MSDSTCPDEPEKCYGDIRHVRSSTNNWATDLNSANDVGTIITYKCDLDDSGVVVTSECLSSGKWSSPMPSACPIAPQCCSADPYFDHSLVTITWDSSHDLGAEAVYECALARIPGQEATTIKTHCQGDGAWSEVYNDITSACYISECFDPEAIDAFYTEGYRLGDVATQEVSPSRYLLKVRKHHTII